MGALEEFAGPPAPVSRLTEDLAGPPAPTQRLAAKPDEAPKKSGLRRFAENLGVAGISLASGVPGIELKRMALDNEARAIQNRTAEQQAELELAEVGRQSRQQELSQAAFGGGPDQDKALRQLMVEFPEIGEQAFNSIQSFEQSDREEDARFASEILATPFPQRRAKFLKRATELESAGIDASETISGMSLPEEQQNNEARILVAAALSSKDRLAGQSGADIPAGQREFESLIAGFSDEDKTKARRVKARIDAPAGTSSTERIALDKELADLVASSQATIREAGKFAEATGADRVKRIGEGADTIGKIEANIRTLDDALDALDGGADSGPIINRFTPTIRAQSVILEQIRSQLGLDVVGSVQFGALSEGELGLALRTALPDLPPKELRQWIVDRQEAQGKLRDYLNQQVQFLSAGGSISEWLDRVDSKKKSGDKPEADNTDALLEFMTPEERKLFER